MLGAASPVGVDEGRGQNEASVPGLWTLPPSLPPRSFPDDDDIDLDDLVEAPPESVKTPIDRLAEAFPGSELIVETG